MISNVDDATTGTSPPKAKPCTVAKPIRNPVNEPGPMVTPIASSCCTVWLDWVRSSLTIAITNRVWERGSSEYLEVIAPSTISATEQAGVEVSIAKNDAILNPIIARQKKSPTRGEGFYRSGTNYTIRISWLQPFYPLVFLQLLFLLLVS